MSAAAFTLGKVEPPPCDGWNHPWSYGPKIVCKGCGIRFTDVDELDREMALRQRGLVEDRAAVRARVASKDDDR